jgi:flagellar operon protein
MTTIPIFPGTPPPAPAIQQATRTLKSVNRTDTNTGLFQRELDSRIQPEGLTFSRHAQKRLDMRGISFTPEGLQRIENAVDRLAEKGSRDGLVVAGKLALVVGVDNRTVVTVMDQDSMEESVVTNIDSAVFA